jgi:hypothetical protein
VGVFLLVRRLLPVFVRRWYLKGKNTFQYLHHTPQRIVNVYHILLDNLMARYKVQIHLHAGADYKAASSGHRKHPLANLLRNGTIQTSHHIPRKT